MNKYTAMRSPFTVLITTRCLIQWSVLSTVSGSLASSSPGT